MSERPRASEASPPGRPADAQPPLHAHEVQYTPPHGSIESDREIQYRQLIWMGLGLLVIAVVSAVLVFFMLRGFVSWRAETADAPPVIPQPAPAAGPQLLARPEQELAEVRRGEKERLESYGWLEPASGVVHIPIERAMAIVAAKGLPARGTVAPTAVPAAAPSAAAPAPAPPPPPGEQQ